MRLFAYPFRVGVSGSIATVDQDSEAADAQLLAALVRTRPGERPLVPAFGVPDPAFDGLSTSAVVAGVEMFGPDVTITEVRTRYLDATTQEVWIDYD